MKISDIRAHVVEIPGRTATVLRLGQVPGLRRTQYTHHGQATQRPLYQYILRVQTDEGVEGLCTIEPPNIVGDVAGMVELLRVNVLGEDPFAREYIFQKLHLGTRWLYQKPGWFGSLDNCLWDIAGKVAGLPIYKLIGKCRDGVPIYQTAGNGPLEEYIAHIEQGKELGIRAYKTHTYKGGKADYELLRKLREYVGPDFDLINDPVCSYTLREAIELGHLMEELDFVWLEEPFHDERLPRTLRRADHPCDGHRNLDVRHEHLCPVADQRRHGPLAGQRPPRRHPGAQIGPLCRAIQHQDRAQRHRRPLWPGARPPWLLHSEQRLL